MLDPASCGPAFLGLCQDVQELACDYPEAFFTPTLHAIPRPRADKGQIARAVERIKSAKRPLIISGGGVRYSGAGDLVGEFAGRHGIPVSETIAGKGTLTHRHPAHIGPIGVIGSSSANAIAKEADVVLAIGTRLQDFTTGSWSAFHPDAQFVSINAARFDAVKHRAICVAGDALETLIELDAQLGSWKTDVGWMKRGVNEFEQWNKLLDKLQAPTNASVPTYAQVVGAVNRKAGAGDRVIAAAGGLPGEVTKGWRVKNQNTFDCEFGFSCMGYEIAGGWGAAMANPDSQTFVMTGDGSYLMMNSDIYSSVLSGHKMIVVVCDNGGFGVINRLQIGKGGAPFNNLIRDSKVKKPFSIDFVRHAESMGALARAVESIGDLENALDWAKSTDRTTVISINTDAYEWAPGDAWWDVGVPGVSARPAVQAAHAEQAAGRKHQRVGV
jgi:3D-(3,5/4)-trihydroxycyclohexane-1,2-dione acylhydrolase (decyclizing)